MNNDPEYTPRDEGSTPRKEQQEQKVARRRQDGYADTQGPDYDDSQRTYGRPARDTPAQQGYDPAQSGVRPAKNQPGRRVDTPGRDTGTSWGQDEQMGSTTDTPDRQNPAN
ncbi:MAG TPA: hypothetical protein VL485_17040 [Ktedonobacteraceae bacterium]|nr:hypothetical protein [Ktedonobacteraceae bacterium]